MEGGLPSNWGAGQVQMPDDSPGDRAWKGPRG